MGRRDDVFHVLTVIRRIVDETPPPTESPVDDPFGLQPGGQHALAQLERIRAALTAAGIVSRTKNLGEQARANQEGS